jgi:hypothetical protein
MQSSTLCSSDPYMSQACGILLKEEMSGPLLGSSTGLTMYPSISNMYVIHAVLERNTWCTG